MIKLVSINGSAVPKIFCDSCGKEISDAKKAGIVFRNFMGSSQNTDVIYVHKNFISENCMTKAEELIRSKGGTSGWIELSQYIAFLASNAGITGEGIVKHLSR